jgi:hypothetical protein
VVTSEEVAPGRATEALFRFHARSGLRVALRGPVPIAAVAIAAVGTQADPEAVVVRAARAMAGSGEGRMGSALLAAAAFVIAAWAAGRLAAASEGYLRHLPAGARSHRRAVFGALVVAQAPVAVAAMGLVAVAAITTGFDWARVLAMPLIFLGAAQAAAPSGRPVARVLLGGLACACGVWGHWAAPGIGLMGLALYDALDPEPSLRLHSSPRFSRAGQASRPRLAWRAVGFDAAAPFVVAAVPLAAGFIMIANNALTSPATGRVARLTGLLAASQSMALLSTALSRSLPVWGWARSLPRSSAHRVVEDALLLAAPALAACLVTLRMDPAGGAAVAACVPALALRGAGWMRPDRRGRGTEEWIYAAEGAAAAGMLCLVPWMAAAGVAAVPLALRWAAGRERDCRVSA